MRSISILSVFVVVIPFVGLPSVYQTTFLVFVGVIIFVKSLLIERSHKPEGDVDTDLVFKQNEFPEIKKDLHPMEMNKEEEHLEEGSNHNEQNEQERE